jgi:hypothetical protein
LPEENFSLSAAGRRNGRTKTKAALTGGLFILPFLMIMEFANGKLRNY